MPGAGAIHPISGANWLAATDMGKGIAGLAAMA
jgi:hypothetical protein